MHLLPLWLRRPLMIARGLFTNRSRPDLRRLNKIRNPEQFVWAILPHAARSFAASILLLPAHVARASAVAYLYARMLDTYEDMSDSPQEAQAALRNFAARFSANPLAPAPVRPSPERVHERDSAHLLLIDRHAIVDEMYHRLPEADRARIRALVTGMAEGMVEYSEVFHRQGGVLESPEQVVDYCHRVIGLPALFVLETMYGDLPVDHRRHALKVAEMIQLANITRDVEKDLESGVAYHPELRPHLGSNGRGPAERAVQQARRDLMLMATAGAASFRHLLEHHELPHLSPARSAAVLLMLFTDRHYRRMAASVGIPDWRGPKSLAGMLMTSLPAAWSPQWADRVVRRAESGLLAVA